MTTSLYLASYTCGVFDEYDRFLTSISEDVSPGRKYPQALSHLPSDPVPSVSSNEYQVIVATLSTPGSTIFLAVDRIWEEITRYHLALVLTFHITESKLIYSSASTLGLEEWISIFFNPN